MTVLYSLIGDNTGTGLAEAQTPDANGNLIGTSTAPIDPLLGPLAGQWRTNLDSRPPARKPSNQCREK